MMSYRCLLASLALAELAWAGSAPAYRISTIAGSSLLGDGGLATNAQIGNIQGIAVDHLGNIYLSDTDHHRVRRIATTGTITTVAGTGAAGFAGDGGAATSAALNFPYGLAVDAAGYLYIADLGNNRVRRVTPTGTISTYAGGSSTSVGDGGPAAAAELLGPRNLAIDAAGTLYIAEFEGHRVRKVTADGRIATVAGTGVAGFAGDGGLAVNAQVAFPAGLALDRSGILYIADSQNQRIRKVLATGVMATALGGSTTTALLSPIAVALDSVGDIYTGDSTEMVHAYTTLGAWATIAGTGAPAFSGDGGLANAASLTAPRDLAFDPAGNLLIADGVRIRRVNTAGQIQTIAGDAYLHAVGDGAPATSAMLSLPSAAMLDASGDLYIADTGTERIRLVAPGGNIATVAGTGIAGYDHDQVAATAAELYSPMSVAMGLAGTVYIADTYNHRIRRVVGGTISTYAGTGVSGTGSEGLPAAQTLLRGPRGVCTDIAGTLYIVDTSNHRVLRAGADGKVATMAGNGTPGDAGDGGLARLAELNQPSACAVDSLGRLFIADTFSHRIRRVSTDGTIATVAGTGAAASAIDEVQATVSPLNTPQGIAVDGNGNLFISDTANNRVRMVTADGVIHTIAGTGAAGYSGDDGDATLAMVSTPLSLTIDGAGGIYFADALNNRIRCLTPTASQPETTSTTPVPALTLVNAASLAQGAVAPGETVTIYGGAMGPEQGVAGTYDSTGLLANLVAGTEVRFDGLPAPVFYAQSGQINAQAPYTIAGQNYTHIEVRYQSQTVGTLDLPVATASPALFAAVLNQDGSLNSATVPAARGTIVTLYATGEGLTNGANIAGQPAAAPYPAPAAPVTLSIGGVSAQLLYAGSAPGYVGLLQIDAIVPGGFVASGQVAVVLQVGTVNSPVVAMWVE